jgi:hypothetical protein
MKANKSTLNKSGCRPDLRDFISQFQSNVQFAHFNTVTETIQRTTIDVAIRRRLRIDVSRNQNDTGISRIHKQIHSQRITDRQKIAIPFMPSFVLTNNKSTMWLFDWCAIEQKVVFFSFFLNVFSFFLSLQVLGHFVVARYVDVTKRQAGKTAAHWLIGLRVCVLD